MDIISGSAKAVISKIIIVKVFIDVVTPGLRLADKLTLQSVSCSCHLPTSLGTLTQKLVHLTGLVSTIFNSIEMEGVTDCVVSEGLTHFLLGGYVAHGFLEVVSNYVG